MRNKQISWIKKIVPSSILSLILIATVPAIEANAKTEGSYVKASLLRSKLTTKNDITNIEDGYGPIIGKNGHLDDPIDVRTPINNSSTHKAYGFGLAYGYAFNYNGAFVAPEAFMDWNRLNQNSSLKVDSNYGLKLNVGYDLTDRFALYGIMGASKINYTQYFNRTSSQIGLFGVEYTTENNSIKTKSNISLLYGIGAKFKVDQDIDLGLEYTSQTFRVKPSEETGIIVANSSDFFNGSRNRLDVIRLTLSYQFQFSELGCKI